MKSIGILGSTGSIGTQTLEIVKTFKNQFSLKYLLANSNDLELLQQINLYRPKFVCLVDMRNYDRLKENIKNKSTKILCGLEGLEELARTKVDICINAISGYHGLMATIFAIEESIDVALANKESLVMAGSYINKLLKKNNSKIFPVDSEHSAIWQCLKGEKSKDIKNIILTGSGGPFRTLDKSDFKKITKPMALNHPNWSMGEKITIDSSTMMNKGLEVIEAKWLFGVSHDQIKIVIHPQSIIHSMVEFNDCSIKAQLGVPDMKIPIQYALTYPYHVKSKINPSLDFKKFNSLTFEEPDIDKFKCIKLAYNAMQSSDSYCTVLNVANDETVYAFLNNKVSYIDIPNIIEKAMNRHDPINNLDLEKIKKLIKWTKDFVKREVN